MTVPDQILAQARRTPDAVAVRQWDTRLTYTELTERAAAVADALRDMGAGPGTRVGLCATRDVGYVVTVLGVLLSGACYVPLEPGGPRRRLLEIADDADVTIVVGDAAAAEFGDAPGIRTLAPEGTATPRPCPATEHDVFHVLYTSGSTGRPKGVLTTHRNVAAYVAGWQELYPLAPGTRTLAASSLGFDAVTIDFFVTLTAGTEIQLVPAEDRADPERLRRFLVTHDIEWGLLTPTMLSTVDPADVPSWRRVFAGGEPLPADLVARWAPGRQFVNVYGPTETTVSVVTGPVTADHDPVPIGRVTPGHRLHVVDDQLRPVPDGQPGELLVGGPGVADGYLGRPALTAERFLPDPFGTHPGDRLYRTGDRVRRDPDGTIVHLGRIDRQVKVRGQRIELGEIEAVLVEHPAVRHAAVEAVTGTTGTRLVAFLAPATAPGDTALAEFTAPRLTTAMRPELVLRRDELPTDPRTGKLDRATLRALAAQAVADLAADTPDYDGTPTEQAIARVWATVLGQTPTRDTDFFTGGGNSITAMRLVAALRDRLGRQLSVKDLFTTPTVPALAALLDTAAPLPGRELTTGNPPTLSPPQTRLWFTDQLAPDDAPYNIALAQKLTGPLDVPALRAALRAVADRHDVLRWRIKQTAGAPYAERTPPADVPMPVVDVTDHADLHRRLAAGARHVFDLATAPAWHVALYRLARDEHVLAITVHHAVFDGWSEARLYTDLADAYQQATTGATPALPPLRATYADYAVWRDRRDRATGTADLAWWTQHLADAPTVLDLPRDRPRPAAQTYTGAETSVTFPPHVDTAVRAAATRLGATPAGVLLAGLAELLRRLTGNPDHVLGAIVADRTHAEFDDAIGFFIDTVPVRLRAGGRTFADTVHTNAAGLRDATAHPAAPLDRIVDALGVPRDTARAPLVQVLFNVLNFTEPRLRLSGLDTTPIAVPKPGSPFDLTVYVVERDGRLAFDTVHNPDLFDTSRVDALLTDLTELVGALADTPDADPADVAPHLPRTEVRTPAPGAMTVAAPEVVTVTVPIGNSGGADTSADTAAMEQLLTGIWRDVLDRDTVGLADNFFDIGGHSMAMAAVHGRLTAATGRQIRMLDLFRYPNIRALAAHLAGPQDKPLLAAAANRAAARRNRARRNPPRRTTGSAQ
ncbi:amino acid adenylation domain-containing protein [Actinophytocola sp. NPDC049390]|uniref:amino acid adenylation domain-containing protein n=1 Tax=Actinophytocola sp. NPDC049390 TaxID=3363894 RepID=UPI0037902EE5